MADLLELREKIDQIDRQMVELFEERMDICRQVAEYKIANGKKVLDRDRELQKLDVLGALAHGEFNRHGVRELFQQIMAMSRKLQYQLLAQEGVSGSLPFTRIDRIDREHCRVVYQGVEGAYSHEAAMRYFDGNVNMFHMASWRECMEAIKEGMADYAVLPIENSSAGEVNDIYDLLEEYENYIVGEQILAIRHTLAGLPGTKLSDIRTVYSHPQALMQCSAYLEQHGWQQISLANTAMAAEIANTAMAAEKIYRDQDKTQAAIASEAAARIHGLQILEQPINDSRQNSTRFIIVTNRKMYEQDAKKVSICFELIIYNDLNMCKIESRPIPEKNWEYHFFVDFDGNLNV